MRNKTALDTRVAILLCTYNGECYLREQLNSILKQTYTEWTIWASDDGSQDTTVKIMTTYERELAEGRLRIRKGPGRGFASNFMSLVRDSSIQSRFYAYADQDDIWDSRKLEQAVHWLTTVPSEIPALYCSSTILVNEYGEKIGVSNAYRRLPGFANALVQNIASGNTMVFNRSAREVLCKLEHNSWIVFHDWWTYLAISACGGWIKYDSTSNVMYRQHGNNQVGVRSGFIANARRPWRLVRGDLQRVIDGHLRALSRMEDLLTPENREILRCFLKARRSSLIPRLFLYRRSRIYRQTLLGNIGLAIAAVIQRI